MKHAIRALTISMFVVSVASAADQPLKPDEPPSWAYPNGAHSAPPAASANDLIHMAGSKASYTAKDLKDFFAVPDWRPDDHPAMPAVVSAGRKPEVMACGYCHLATGAGRTENAALAGLPKDYIVAQMARFRDGSRTSAVSGRTPIVVMIKIAKASTPEDDDIAARYFSALPARSYVTVVEASDIPEVEVAGLVYRPTHSGKREAIGQRVIEVADDFEQFDHRDPDTRYTAYVPVGSLEKGRAIAAGWGPQGAFACSNCHGAGLMGAGAAPPLAGRSPTATVRALYDYQTKARSGAGAAGMQAVVKSMQPADMVAVSAYIGSLRPR